VTLASYPYSFLYSLSSTLDPQSSILNPLSSILNPQPSILYSLSSILNPQSSIILPSIFRRLLKFTPLDLANCLGYDDRIEKKQKAGPSEEYDNNRGRRLTNDQRKSSSGVIPT
jgi:hypothetical protein